MNHGYIRVSSDDQAHSVDAQRDRINRWCQYQGVTIDQWYHDQAVSGGKHIAKRPGGKALCEALQPGDRIIATQIDRLFRNLVDGATMDSKWSADRITMTLVDEGGDVIDTAKLTGWQTFIMRLFFAESERRATSERMLKIKDRLRADGAYLGGTVPYGWTVLDTGELKEVEEEQAIITTVRDMRDAGGTWRGIADALNQEGVPTRKGGLWRHHTIRGIIKRAG